MSSSLEPTSPGVGAASEFRMLCQDLMKTDVETCGVDDSVAVAARKMKRRGVGFLPVINERGLPIGVLTDRDIVLRVVAEGLDAEMRSVVDVMTLEIVSCRETDDLSVAEQLMAQNHKMRVVVIDEEGVLSGVISLSDIAQADEPTRTGETLRDVSELEVARELE